MIFERSFSNVTEVVPDLKLKCKGHKGIELHSGLATRSMLVVYEKKTEHVFFKKTLYVSVWDSLCHSSVRGHAILHFVL